jgi:hypothetical protein
MDTTVKKNCRVCQKLCAKRCPRCHAAYYCNGAHKKQDWPRHKKECDATHLTQTYREIDAKVSEMLKDIDINKEFPPETGPVVSVFSVVRYAWEAYLHKYDTDRFLGFRTYLPSEKVVDEARNRVLWKLTESMECLTGRETIAEFDKRGFDANDFWRVWTCEKSGPIHSALLAALKSLSTEYGVRFELPFECKSEDGKSEIKSQRVENFGLAMVEVTSESPFVVPVYDWSNKDQSKWTMDERHLKDSTVIFFRTTETSRMLLDLTGPKYGVTSFWNGTPYFCKDAADCTNIYTVSRILSAQQNEELLAVGLLKAIEKNDERPKMIVAFKDYIVKRVMDNISGLNMEPVQD